MVNTSFTADGRGKDLKAKAHRWLMQGFSAVTPQIMLRIGQAKDSEEAKEKADEAIRNMDAYSAEGGVVGFRFGSVVGRKKAPMCPVGDTL